MVRTYLSDFSHFSRRSFLVKSCELVWVFFPTVLTAGSFLFDFSKSFSVSRPQSVPLNDDINDTVCLPPRQLIIDD